MSDYDNPQSKCYEKATKRAQEALSNWTETAARLKEQGLSDRERDSRRKQLEREAKGVFRS